MEVIGAHKKWYDDGKQHKRGERVLCFHIFFFDLRKVFHMKYLSSLLLLRLLDKNELKIEMRFT